MARIIVIGGIESTFTNLQVLHDLGEEVVMFYTRGEKSRGWQGVKMINEDDFPAAKKVPRTVVQGHINDHLDEMRKLNPDFIYSLGWQQIYSNDLLRICPVIGIHESLLPAGAGAVPIANAILHNVEKTGVSLFWLDGGMDTGPLIGQLQGLLDPRTADATALYKEAMALERDLLRMYVPHLNRGSAPKIYQDFTKRTEYKKVNWESHPADRVARARVYPYA